jgi:hypothetical protein
LHIWRKKILPNPGSDTLSHLNHNAEKIRTHLNSKKAPEFDLITGEILKHLKRKALVKLTTLFNACIRLKHVPDAWKIAEIIMIPKPG